MDQIHHVSTAFLELGKKSVFICARLPKLNFKFHSIWFFLDPISSSPLNLGSNFMLSLLLHLGKWGCVLFIINACCATNRISLWITFVDSFVSLSGKIWIGITYYTVDYILMKKHGVLYLWLIRIINYFHIITQRFLYFVFFSPVTKISGFLFIASYIPLGHW